MKKNIRFLVCILIIYMLGGVGACTAFAEDTDITKSLGWGYNGGISLDWSGTGDDILDGYVAVYDSSGALIQIAHGNETPVRLLPHLQSGDYTIKSFLWNSNIQPKSESEQLDIKSIPCTSIISYSMNNDSLTEVTAETSGGAYKYKISGNTSELHVNGVSMPLTAENWNKYVTDNSAGTLMLQDTDHDSLYDDLCVTYYVSGVVSSVSSFMNTVSFRFTDFEDNSGSVRLDDDATVQLNGNTVNIADLRRGDVVSVAYDVSTDIYFSDFYEIIASRNEITGIVEEFDAEKGCLVNGQYYKPINPVHTPEVGASYRLWTDVFNRLVYYEEDFSSCNIGILEKLYSTIDDEVMALFIDKHGNTNTYILKSNEEAEEAAQILGGHWSEHGFEGEKADLCNRVIQYRIYDDRYLSIINSIECTSFGAVYDEDTAEIGSFQINKDACILDETNYSDSPYDASQIQMSNLVDGTIYRGFASMWSTIDMGYNFVVITGEGIQEYNDDTNFVVFNSERVVVESDGNTIREIEFYQNGKLVECELDPDFCAVNQTLSAVLNKNIALGDVMLIKTNSNRQINEIHVLYDNNLSNGYEVFEKEALAQLCGQKTEDIFNIPQEWRPYNKNSDVEIAFGPIVNKSAHSLSLAVLNSDGVSYEWNNVDFDLPSSEREIEVYVFDSQNSGNNRLYVGNKGDIVRSTGFYSNAESIDWTSPDIYTNFAIIKSIDGYATQVFVILSD